MKNRKKSNKIEDAGQQSTDFDLVLLQLANAIAADTQNRLAEESDPLEIYLLTVRSKLYKDVNTLHSRLTAGYHAMLEELHQH